MEVVTILHKEKKNKNKKKKQKKKTLHTNMCPTAGVLADIKVSSTTTVYSDHDKTSISIFLFPCCFLPVFFVSNSMQSILHFYSSTDVDQYQH
jgi:hypothetical protein